jgi:hypothetical protein
MVTPGSIPRSTDTGCIVNTAIISVNFSWAKTYRIAPTKGITLIPRHWLNAEAAYFSAGLWQMSCYNNKAFFD